MLREELDDTNTRLKDADRKCSAAEHMATRLGEQVDDLRAYAADAEAACVKVSPRAPDWLSASARATPTQRGSHADITAAGGFMHDHCHTVMTSSQTGKPAPAIAA